MSDCIEFDQAMARLRGRVEAQRLVRQRKWRRIKEEAPEIAEFLTEVNEVFGKPEKTWVMIGDERIV